MSNFYQILLALFGAAFLGSVIGWCARRIVALKDEKFMAQRYEHDMQRQTEALSRAEVLLAEADRKAVLLEKRAQENDLLSQTLAIKESDLDELRRESGRVKSLMIERDSTISDMNEELRAQRVLAGNAQSESQLLRQQLLQKDNEINLLSSSGSPSAPPLQQKTASGGRLQVAPMNGENDYRMFDLLQDSADIDVDPDIADITADIDELLKEEDSLAAESARLTRGLDSTTASSSQAASDASPASERQYDDSAKAEEPAPVARRGLFSGFNRKNKR